MTTKRPQHRTSRDRLTIRPALDGYASICSNDLEALQSAGERMPGWHYEAVRVCLHWAVIKTCYPAPRLLLSGFLFLAMFMYTGLALWQMIAIALAFALIVHPLMVFGLFRFRATGVYEQISRQRRAIHDRREEVNAIARRFCGSGANPLM